MRPKVDKPTVFLVFDPFSKLYLDRSKWSRFAEDATEYPSAAVANIAVVREGKKLKRRLRIVPTTSHYRRPF